MSEVTQPVSWAELALILSAMPGTLTRLLEEHVDVGGRCRKCTVAGTGEPGERWPCAVRQLAELAAEQAGPDGGRRLAQLAGEPVDGGR